MRNKELETILFTRHTKTFEILLQPSFCKISPEFQHDSIWNWFPKSSCSIPNPNPLFPIYVCELQNSHNERSNDEKSPKRRELGGNNID